MLYVVTSPVFTTTVDQIDFGGDDVGPIMIGVPGDEMDYVEVDVPDDLPPYKQKRRAVVLGMQEMRRQGMKWVQDSECPFTGLTAERLLSAEEWKRMEIDDHPKWYAQADGHEYLISRMQHAHVERAIAEEEAGAGVRSYDAEWGSVLSALNIRHHKTTWELMAWEQEEYPY
jgi:hypothetical protein